MTSDFYTKHMLPAKPPGKTWISNVQRICKDFLNQACFSLIWCICWLPCKDWFPFEAPGNKATCGAFIFQEGYHLICGYLLAFLKYMTGTILRHTVMSSLDAQAVFWIWKSRATRSCPSCFRNMKSRSGISTGLPWSYITQNKQCLTFQNYQPEWQKAELSSQSIIQNAVWLMVFTNSISPCLDAFTVCLQSSSCHKCRGYWAKR